MDPSPLRKRLLIGGAVVLALVLGMGTVVALSTWSQVKRVTIDRSSGSLEAVAAGADDPAAPSDDAEQGADDTPPFVVPTQGVDVFLLVGSDSRDDLETIEGFGDFEGERADVVMILLRTESEAALLSLPRDLWVDDLCSGGKARLNQMLEGCGDDMNGPTALTLTVEDLIGVTVDHFALVDLAGFQAAVDAIGGYEICVENAVRDARARLDLAAGCTLATGEQALAWLRSRHTQELTTDGWRVVPGVSDLARNERQRAFLIDIMGRLGDFGSPQAMASVAQAVAPFVTVDSELTLVGAVNIAWTMRGLGSGALLELEVPVADFVTEDGAAVLLASQPVDQIISGFLAPETAGAGGPVAG